MFSKNKLLKTKYFSQFFLKIDNYRYRIYLSDKCVKSVDPSTTLQHSIFEYGYWLHNFLSNNLIQTLLIKRQISHFSRLKNVAVLYNFCLACNSTQQVFLQVSTCSCFYL